MSDDPAIILKQAEDAKCEAEHQLALAKDTIASLRVELEDLKIESARQLEKALVDRNEEHKKNAQAIVDQANAELAKLTGEVKRFKALYEALRQVVAAHEAHAPEILKVAMMEHQRAVDQQLLAQIAARSGAPTS